jgi:hypothetical protein
MLAYFRGFPEWGTVVEEISVSTSRLDDVIGEDALDFLKIDIQGGELTAIENGRRCLAHAVAIQVEVSFLPLYETQPTFSEIDQALRKLGFIPHAFAKINRRMIAPLVDERNPYAALNQLLEVDVVYVRNFTQPDAMTDEQLKHLAIVAHHCYRSFDLATTPVPTSGHSRRQHAALFDRGGFPSGELSLGHRFPERVFRNRFEPVASPAKSATPPKAEVNSRGHGHRALPVD